MCSRKGIGSKAIPSQFVGGFTQSSHLSGQGSDLHRDGRDVGPGIGRRLLEAGQLLSRGQEVTELALLLRRLGDSRSLFSQRLVDESGADRGLLALTMAPFQARSNAAESSTARSIAS